MGFFTKKAEKTCFGRGGETVHVNECWKIAFGDYLWCVSCCMQGGKYWAYPEEIINTWDCVKDVAYGI